MEPGLSSRLRENGDRRPSGRLAHWDVAVYEGKVKRQRKGEFMAALYHYDSEDDVIRIGEGFCACTLPKAEWTHGAHWAAAFWLILRRPDMTPEREMPDLTRRYNLSVGGENTDMAGYHETITQASLIVARSFIAMEDDAPALHEICNRLFASPFGRSDWLFDYWTKETLFTVRARKEWVPPDIKPLVL